MAIIQFLKKNINPTMISFLTKPIKKAIFTSLLLPSITMAEVNVNELMSILPEGTSVGVIAKNLDTNQVIANYQSSTFMLPASTQKVFTALAAKVALPQNFRFQTALLTNGVIENGVLKGDLIARFTGDPDLTSGQLTQLISQLKQKGINHIEGDLIVDTSVFTGHDKASGWPWNDLTICFSAPPAAINIDNNCFYVNLDANQPVGSLVKIDVPSAFPVQMFSLAYIANKAEASHCELDIVVNDNNRYHLKGCIAQQDKPVGLSFAVQDPLSYGASLINSNLKRLGITFKGRVQQAIVAQQGTVLAEHFSAPLQDLLKKMMKKSDNQIADALFRTIANQQSGRPASFPSASQTVRNVLKTKAGIQFGNSILADGSGLSRHNLVSAKTLLQTLEVIAKNEDLLNLFETFPIAGVDGTLSGRASLIKEPLVKNVIAKTGALKGVYNLAGFMKNARGERIAFVQFINGYSTGELDSKTKRGALSQFEHRLFMGLYKD